MNTQRCLILVTLMATLGFSSEAFATDIFKCPVRGRTVFQDHPCAGAAVGTPYRSDGPATDPGLSVPVYPARTWAPGSSQLVRLRQDLADATAYSRQLQRLYDADVKMTRLRVASLPKPEQQRAAEALRDKWQAKLQAASQRERTIVDEMRRLCPHGAVFRGQTPQCGR